MGKNQHSKDRMFITATEWAKEYGGRKAPRGPSGVRALPFDHCALSLAPFRTPVLVGRSGVVYELDSVAPYLRAHGRDPATGDAASEADIVRLHMERNSDGLWHCPVTCKVFTDNSRIVAIRSTGNVFSHEAVAELNLKAKDMTDLLSGAPFTREDIITLQDPHNAELCARRDVNNFVHMRQLRQEAETARGGESKVRLNPTSEAIMRAIDDKAQRERESRQKRKTLEEMMGNGSSSQSSLEREMEQNEDVRALLALGATTADVNPGQVITDGRASSSFTSTASTVCTSAATRLATADELREAKWRTMRALGKKGHAQLQTTLGNINLEIHCDLAPRAAWNFVTLCNRRYFDGLSVHRLVPGFMLQSGDPTGSGAGGSSAFPQGRAFKDEFDPRLRHAARGVLSMANSGADSNGSQFFVTFKAAAHLDNRHSIFGRVVGGMATLDRIEAVGATKSEKPLQEIKILQAVVFTNPIEEAEQKLDDEIRFNMKVNRQQKIAKATPAGALPSSSSSNSNSSSGSAQPPAKVQRV